MHDSDRETAPTRRLWDALLALALISPGVLPLVCAYLPFQDWPAHVGVVGALLHVNDPAARVLEFYEYVGWFKLNAAFYLPAYLFAQVMPALTAVNLTFGISLAALGPATAYFCRAVGAPRGLALFAVPLAMGRHVYCGFAPNAAALALMMVTFGAFYRYVGAPTARRWGGLLLALVLLAFTHAFVYLAAAGLLLLAGLFALGRGHRRPAGLALAALGLSGVWFAVVFVQGLGVSGHGEGQGPLMAIWTAIQQDPRKDLGGVFWEWLFASYRYASFDDVLQGIWAGALALGVAASIAVARRRWLGEHRGELLFLAAVAAFMFWLLPSNVGPPVNWWGARLRLPVMVMLLLVPLAGPALARLRHAVAVPALIAVATVGAFAVDLAAFEREEMAGFSEAVEAIEPGRKISFLHYTGKRVDEYPGVALGYFGNFAFLEHGGAVSQDFFQRREYPIVRKKNLPAPPWALASSFRWPQHAEGYDGFLVRLHPRTGKPPFPARALDGFEEVSKVGNWGYYRVRAR